MQEIRAGWNRTLVASIRTKPWVGCVPLRLSPDRSDQGLIPAHGPQLHVLPSIPFSLSHTIIRQINGMHVCVMF